MTTVTVSGVVKDETGRKDSRDWKAFSPVYREGSDGEVLTMKRQPVRVVAGIFTAKLQPGICVLENPDGQRYTVTVPNADADLWDLIEAAVALPPDTAQEALAAAVASYLTEHPPTVDTPANETSIRAAVTALGSTGGIVKIAPGTVTLTSPLLVVAGVVYQGSPPVLQPTNTATPAYLGDMEPSFVGGTRLVGNGTFAAFEANSTDLGSPASPIGATQISNAGIRGFAIDNFTYGVHVGAKNTMGAVWGVFEDLYITRCSQWGVKLVNFQHCRISNIKTWTCQSGQFYGNDLAASIMMCGNSTLDELFNMVPRDGRDQRLCRGIVFDAGTGDGILNELMVGRIQVNQFKGSQLSVAATFTNGSANIGVPDGTKFAVNMPVVLTGSGNGFNANTTYLVASVVGNVITLKPDVTASAIVASGAMGLTLTSWGFPNLEITRQSGTASVKNSKWQHIDIEGAATAGCYIDGAGQVDISFAEHPSARDHDLVLRKSAFVRVVSMNALKSDFDGDGASAQVSGQRERIIGNEGTGIWLDSTNGSRGISLTGYSGGAEVTTGDGGVWVGRFGEASHPAGFSGNLDPGWLGHATWVIDANRAMTIIDPSAGRLGDWHQVNNTGVNTVTVTTQNGVSPTFNRIAGLQSISVPTKSWAKFVCVAGDDGNPFWLVTKGPLATA